MDYCYQLAHFIAGCGAPHWRCSDHAVGEAAVYHVEVVASTGHAQVHEQVAHEPRLPRAPTRRR